MYHPPTWVSVRVLTYTHTHTHTLPLTLLSLSLFRLSLVSDCLIAFPGPSFIKFTQHYIHWVSFQDISWTRPCCTTNNTVIWEMFFPFFSEYLRLYHPQKESFPWISGKFPWACNHPKSLFIYSVFQYLLFPSKFTNLLFPSSQNLRTVVSELEGTSAITSSKLPISWPNSAYVMSLRDEGCASA